MLFRSVSSPYGPGRQLAEREAFELPETDSLLYASERDWSGTVVSPRRFTAEVLAAVGSPFWDSAEGASLAYRQSHGGERPAMRSASR